MSVFQLLYIKWFGGNGQKITGVNLFSSEYNQAEQLKQLTKLYSRGKPAIVRMPVQDGNLNEFIKLTKLMNGVGITIVALLDEFKNDNSMMNRLSTIRTLAPFVKYFELFNELPHMIDLYQGEKIMSLQSLLDKTNKYCDWIHANIKDSVVITMAPYDSLDEREYPVWGVTNTRILKDLILYTKADKAAMHIYKDSFGAQLDAIKLAANIKDWNKEAKQYEKEIWITETGADKWSNHVSYFTDSLKVINNIFNPEEIIWYRHTVKNHAELDNGFALEWQDIPSYSPLYTKLKTQNVNEHITN